MLMKISRLLILGALLFVGSSAKAELVGGVRQKPVPQKSAIQYGEAMYMYNVGAKQMFKGANDYNTRASVGEKGYKVWFTKHLSGGAWDEKSVIWKDSVETQKAIKMVWIADVSGNMWVDWNNQADTLFTILPQAGDIYRFSVGEGNAVYNSASYPNTFIGVNHGIDGGANSRVWAFLEADNAEHFIDWYFVTPVHAETYYAAIEVFEAAQELKTAIDVAKDKGIDVSAQEAVYADEGSSKEAIEAATNTVKEAIAAAEEGAVTADNPVNKTSTLVKNASYDSNKNDGWSGTAPAFQSYTNAEFYNKNYNYYQDITGAPKGVYAVNVQAFYRAGSSAASYTNYVNKTNQNAVVYAKTGADSLNRGIANIFEGATAEMIGVGAEVTAEGLYVPNNMQAAAAYFDAGRYNGNQLFFATEDGNIRIGLAKDSLLSTDWTLFDNWDLMYYGNGADAYQLWLANVKSSAPDYSSLPEGTLTTNGVLEAYTNTLAGLATVSSKAEVIAAIQTIEEEKAKVEANIAAWAAYQAALVKGKATAADGALVGEDKDILADYVDLDAEDVLTALAMTTEEITSETEKLLTMIDNAVKNGITEGADVTDKYLVNANFTEGRKGWTVNAASGGAVTEGGPKENPCFEAWNNSNFDIYQVVKSAPVGVYEISVQGFYRYGRGSDAYTRYMNAEGNIDCPVSVYVNNSTSKLKNVFDEKVACGELYRNEGDLRPFADPDSVYWYPNDMTNSGIAFANNLYTSSSFGLVAQAGDVLRLGVKGNTTQLGDSWAIWDNFKMKYQGFKAEVIKPYLQDAVVTAQAQAGKGMGKEVLELLNTAIEGGNTALAGDDGRTMFDALVAILNANDSVNASIALFQQLEEAATALYEDIQTSKASDATKTEAGTLYENVVSGIGAKNLENSDANSFLAQIAEMRTKLKIPAGEPSDTNPIDMTAVIQTPNFDKDGVNSIEGWQGTAGYNFGNNDTQKSALAIEFYEKTFDMYQDIIGLPDGIYTVEVSAFYRNGSTADDYAKFQEDPLQSNAFIYATSNNETVSSAIALLASGATENLGYAGTTQIAETGLYVPNDMVSATNYFELEKYTNKVIVRVVDGKLRIGVKKDVKVGSDWVIMDSWKLTAYGPNSSLTPGGTSGIESAASTATVAKVEIYSVNGTKTSGLTKGLNIVKTTKTDGTVVVKKIVVNAK